MMKSILGKIKSFSFIGKMSLICVLVFVFLFMFADVIAPHPYNIPSGGALEAPSLNHILGTDDLGIDLWAQVCYGARISIFVGIGTALLAGGGGSIVGMFSAYHGGIVDKFIMRFTDMMIVVPELPVMIVLGAFFGPSVKNIIIVLSIFSWTAPARIIRSRVLSIKEESYIKISQSFGAGFYHIAYKHILPQIYPLIGLNIIKIISKAIVAEASLSFLGLGDPLSKSWGMILNHAIDFKGIYFTDYWKWWVVTPLVCITLLVLSSAFLSRELETMEK